MDAENVAVLQQIFGHASDVTTCDFTPNFTLITGSSDKTIRIWDWSGGGVGFVERSSCSPLCAHKYGVTCVRVSPQGAMFGAGSVDGTVTLWGLRSAEPTRLGTLVQLNGDSIRVLRFAPDSSVLVSAGDSGAMCVWDLIHRSLIRSVFRHEDAVQALAFTADSQLLVSGCSSGVLHVWRVPALTDTTTATATTSEQLPQPVASVDNAHDLGVLCCDIATNIRVHQNNPLVKFYTLATCGNDHSIKIWHISYQVTPKHLGELSNVTVDLINELEGHQSAVTCLRYSANSALLASASLDKSVKLWSPNGDCLKTEVTHTRYVNCVAFSRDSTLLASGSNDKSIIIWDLTGSLTLESELLKPHMQLGYMFSVISDTIQENQVVYHAESSDNAVKLLEIVDDISDGAINACRFYGNHILATGSGDKLVKLFNYVDETQSLEESSFSPFEGHTYSVHSIDFSQDGLKLVSCSQDGSTIIWHTQTGEQVSRIPENDLSVRVCRFSSNANMLITAGDDEKAYIWNTESLEQITVLEGHSDSITSASFTPDDLIVATVSSNGDFKLWGSIPEEENCGICIYVQDDAHDLGVQSCDFSPSLEPVPNTSNVDNLHYLLATCGNDSLLKVWKITIPKLQMANTARYDHMDVKLWRTMVGHGGNVMAVKFSPKTGEILCSTATDRQARIWSVYSCECLHVLDHSSMTISCSFTENMSMLAVGCLDKTLWLWNLPQTLIFQTIVANKIRSREKPLIDWRTEDLAKWLREIDLKEAAGKIMETTLDGQKVLTMSDEEICNAMDLEGEAAEEFILQIRWLKQDDLCPNVVDNTADIPEEFLCPITHELMRNPVKCSDGFTYEKRAITEWFLSGKFTSPMTNEALPNTDYEINHELRNQIHNFLYKKN